MSGNVCTQLSPGCTQIGPQEGTKMSPWLGTHKSPQWTQWSTGWTVLSPPYISQKNRIINLTHLEMEFWKNSFRSWTLSKSFNYLLKQNYKNVKKTFQVGLHWVQGGHYWVTWYSIEYSLNNQVLLYVCHILFFIETQEIYI